MNGINQSFGTKFCRFQRCWLFFCDVPVGAVGNLVISPPIVCKYSDGGSVFRSVVNRFETVDVFTLYVGLTTLCCCSAPYSSLGGYLLHCSCHTVLTYIVR
jgi:hypothetical protein